MIQKIRNLDPVCYVLYCIFIVFLKYVYFVFVNPGIYPCPPSPPLFLCVVYFLSHLHFGESWNLCSLVGVGIN